MSDAWCIRDLHGVPDADLAWPGDHGVHAEGQATVAGDARAELRDLGQGVPVLEPESGSWVVTTQRGIGAVQRERGLPDRDGSSMPRVLVVGLATIELEVDAEPAAVEVALW